MSTSEEKFFEQLAGVREGEERIDADVSPAAEPEAEAELAKATVAPAARAKAAAKKAGGTKLASEENGSEGQLTIDVYQTPTEIVVESAVAGVKPDDLDISVSSDSVTIRGARHREREVREEDYFFQECYWGRFSRSVILPEEVNAEHASVDFKDGILSLHLPKLNRQKAKKLKVKVE